MRRKYTVVLEREEGGGYHAYCPALPGCHSQGETVEESLANIREAAELYLESLNESGELLPPETEMLVTATEVETGAPASAG